MINPLPNNSEDSLKIFYHLTEETRYPALILFILSIIICLSISKGSYPKLKSYASQTSVIMYLFEMHITLNNKGSSDPSHFILKSMSEGGGSEFSASLQMNEEFFLFTEIKAYHNEKKIGPNRFKMTSFEFRVVLCRIRLFRH